MIKNLIPYGKQNITEEKLDRIILVEKFVKWEN